MNTVVMCLYFIPAIILLCLSHPALNIQVVSPSFCEQFESGGYPIPPTFGTISLGQESKGFFICLFPVINLYLLFAIVWDILKTSLYRWRYDRTIKKNPYAWASNAVLWGIVPAQYTLGLLYATGNSVERDRVKAYAWLCLADSNGAPYAEYQIEKFLRSMNKDQLKQAKQLAINLQAASKIEGGLYRFVDPPHLASGSGSSGD